MQSHSTDYIFDFEVKLKHTQLLLQETIRPSLLSNTQEDHGNPMTKDNLQTLKQTIKKVYYELNKWSYVQRDRLRQWIIYTLTKITAVGPKGREDDDSYYEVPEIAWDLLPSEIQDQFKTESQLPDDLPIDLESNQTFALSFLHLMQELMAVDFFSATYNIPPELSCDGTAKWTLADTHANASGSLPKLRRRVDISSSYSTTEVFYEGWMPDVCYSQVSEDGASYDQIFFALADLLRHSDPGWLLSSEQYQSMGEFLETGASFFSSVYLIGSDKGSRIVQAKREICKLLQSIIALKQKKRLLILWEKVFQPLYLEHIEEALWNADDGALLDSVLPYECDRDSSKCQENFSTAVSKVLGLILVPETERRTFSSPLSSPDNSVALMWKSKSTETQVCELRNLCNPDDSTKMVNEEVLRILMQLGLYKKDDLMESMIILLYQLFNKRVDLIEQAKALKPTLDIEEKQTLHLIRQSKAIIKAAFDDDTFHLLGQSQECKPLETKIRKAHLSLFNKQVDWHDQCAAGLINLCYHSLWEITDDVTGRSFETDHELANFKAKREEILEQLGISATVLDQLASTSFLTKTAKSMREDQETVVGIHDQEYFIWEPNPLLACKRNQNMMREEGLHEIVMEFLQKHLKDNQYEHSEAQLYTFELCFEFLYFFCWENPENCQAVSTKSFLLLIFDRLHHGEPAPVYLLEVLTKHLPVVFTILDQKAVEDIIEMITSKLEKSNPEYDLQLLELLLTMVQNDTDPLGSERSKSIAWELMQRIPVSNVKAPLDASITGRTSRMDKSVSRRVSFQSPDKTYEFEKLKLSYGRFSPVQRQNLQNDVNQGVHNQRSLMRTVAKKLTAGSLMAQVAGAAQMRKKLDEEAQGLDPTNAKQLKMEKDSKYDCSTPMTRQRARFHLIYLELLGNLCCMDNVRSDISDYCVCFLSIPDALEALAQSEIDIDIMTALTVYMNGTYFSTHLKDNLWSQHSMKMFEPVLYCYLDVIEQHQHMIRSNDCDSILFQKYEQCITNGIFPLLTNFLKGDWPLVSEEEMVQKRFGKRSRNPSSHATFNMGGNSDTPDELFSPSQPKLTSTNATKMSFFGASDKSKLQSPKTYFINSSKSKTTRMDFVDENKEDPVVVKPTFDTAQPLLPELICGIIRTCLRYGGSSFLDMQDPGFQGLQTWTKGQELLANFFCLADTSGGPPAILNRELCPDDDKDDDFLIREGMDGVKFDSKLKDDITALYEFCNHRKSANSGDGQVAYGRNSEKIRRRMEEYVYNKGWIDFANILERFLDTSLVEDHIQGSPKDCVSHGDSFSPEVKQVATVMRKTIVNYNRFKNEKHGDGLELSTTKNRFFGVAQILPIDKKIQASDHYKRWSRNNSAALENLLGHLCCSVTKVHRPYDPFFMELFTLVVTPDPVRKSKLDFLPNCINPPIEGDHLDADQARSALMELGCQRLVLRLIAFAKNIESDAASSSSKKHKVMLIEAITFACKLLHDGDEEIQEKFFLAFHESRDLDSKDNELGSGFFFGVKAILEHFLERLVEETQNCEAPCGQEVDGSCYPSLEEYDFSGSEKWNQTRNYNRISNEFMISCDLVTRALRMLQLLCEGNNMKAKNLMREQGTRDTVNIVAEVTMLIKTLCMHIGNEFHYVKGKRFNKYVAETIVEGSLDPAIKRKIVAWYCPYIRFKFLRSMIEVCSQAMATLTELVQGPCVRNQLVAGKSRITQVVGPLFTYFGAVQQLYTTDVWDKGKKMNAIWSGVDPYELCKSYKAEMKSFIETFKVDDQWKDDFDEWKWIEETGFIKQAQEHRRKWLEGVRTMPVQGVPESNIYLKIHGLLEVIVPFERDVLGLCNALLEGSHPPHEILDGFHEDLSPEIFIDNLVMHWKPLDQNLQRRSKLRNPLQSQISDWRSNLGNNGEAHGKSDIWWRKEKLFLYMQVFSMLRAFPGGEEFGRVFEILQRKNLMNLSDHLCKVEIISDSRNIQVVYFPKPEIVQRLWGRVEIAKKRNEIVYPSSMAKRDNPEEKLRLFLLQVQGLVGMLREFQMLEGMHNPSDKSLIKWLNPIRWCRQLLALVFQLGDFITVGQVIVNIILNLMILFEAEVGDNGEVEAFHSDGILRTIFDMVTYIHLFCTAFMWISYSLQFVFIGVPDKLHSLDREKDCIFPEIVEKWIFCGKRVFPSDALLYPIFFFQDPGIWYYSCFLGISLYACIKYPVYYAFGLVDLVRQSKLMKYVLQSVTCNLGQVVISICLCFIIMYMISVFAMIREDYRNLYTFEDHINCLDLYSCFMSHLTYGLMSPPIWTTHGFPLDSNPTYDKVFFTVFYVLTINLIFTAIVSGIIIDSFSEMRATMNEISEDARGRCFICHIEKDVFEQHNKDFDNHVKHEHNMWHYLWFKIYLEDKEESEYTGLEQCVKEHFDRQEISFFPIKRAKTFDMDEDEAEKDKVVQKLEIIEEQHNQMHRSLEKCSTQLLELSKSVQTQGTKMDCLFTQPLPASHSDNLAAVVEERLNALQNQIMQQLEQNSTAIQETKYASTQQSHHISQLHQHLQTIHENLQRKSSKSDANRIEQQLQVITQSMGINLPRRPVLPRDF